MNLWPFSRKPEPAPLRFIVATREESRKARIARIHTTLQLGVAVARLSDEERKQAIVRAATTRPNYLVNRQSGERAGE